MKRIVRILLALAVLVCAGCAGQTDGGDKRLCAAVGIVPQAAFVDAVSGGLVDVVTLIPTGYSPANYSPTAQEMEALSDADVYFTLRMPAEEASILPKAAGFNADLKIVDLHEAVGVKYDMISLNGHDGHDHGDTYDPHVWLSPKRAAVMVRTIADTLIEIDPANTDTYEHNAAAYIAQLDALDSEINEIAAGLDNKTFLIYHPSYGYFADDYGLEMLTIETAGKAATAAEIADVIDTAKKSGITVVFYQSEFSGSQAQAVADEIGGTVMKAEPLSYDYIDALRRFAYALGGEDS